MSRPHPVSFVVGICFMALTLEGYDLLMYGTVVPSLLAYEPWSLDAASVGVLGSIVGLGMLGGALTAAATADRWGRRRTLVAAVALFSIAMGCCAIAPTPVVFGAARLIVGLGAGLLMPTAAAILIEFSREENRAKTVASGFVGTCIGGVGAGLLSLWLVPSFGFRAMFLAGMVPAVLFIPVMLKYLPESPAFLAAHGRADAAAAVSAHYGVQRPADVKPSDTVSSRSSGLRALFTDQRAAATVSFWAMTLVCLLVLFGVATWLPSLMKSAGYSLGSSLSFLLVLNVGGAAGALSGAYMADKFGIRPVTMFGFLSAAVALALLSTTPPIAVVYVLVLVAGMGTTGTQILLNTFIGGFYPAGIRTTGLGMALAVGRIGAIAGPTYGGILVTAGAGTSTQLLAFAVPAMIGAVLTLAVRTRKTDRPGGLPQDVVVHSPVRNV